MTVSWNHRIVYWKETGKIQWIIFDFSENMIFMNYDYSQKVLKNLDNNKKVAKIIYIFN